MRNLLRSVLTHSSGKLVLGFLISVCLIPVSASAAITYVQGNYSAPQSPQTTVSVTFTLAQAAGDMNVIAVGWNDSTSTVVSVKDAKGNPYALAVGPTVVNGFATQSIYYAPNIVASTAGSNIVTVTFSTPAAYADIRILEYAGADLINPVDVGASGTGSSASSTTAAVTTTNPTDLLFAANLVSSLTSGPGTGFTSRIRTQPDGDIAEDRAVTVTGSYSAVAPLNPSGQWIMQMVAFRTPSGDTQPPTTPSALTATVNGSQINLAWGASTDNVAVTGYRIERCQGTGCSNFAQIATGSALTYSDSGLGVGSYSYRVRATDAAGNLSAYSNVATGSVLDTQSPTAPANLTASVSGSQITLNWTASADNVAVTGYLLERCQGTGCSNFAQVATPAGPSFSDTNLAIGSYSYRVRATDAAGNLSTYSNTATGTISDTQAPTAPSGLTATVSGSQIALAWGASTDNVGVTGYRVERCQGTGCSNFAQVSAPTVTNFTDTGLGAGSYSYRVRATDAAGNLSPYSTVATGSIPDTQAPTAPANLTATASGSTVNLGWTASTDDVGVTQYSVERCQGTACINFAQIATPTSASYSDASLATGTYSYRVRATDAAGNFSTYSNTATAPISDTQAPGAPAGLTATVSGTQIALTWSASTDNVGVTGYRVERCQGTGCSNFGQISAPTVTSFTDTALGAGSYSYRVRATDAAGNLSAYSAVASGTIPDTQAPTAPGNLTATVNGNLVSLAWTASTDDVGVTQYLIERCQGAACANFAQIATSTTAGFSDSGVSPATSYSYRVRATDAASNLSSYSNIAAVTTPSVVTPTAPTNLTGAVGGPGPVVAAVQGYINSTSLSSHTTAPFDSTGGDAIVMCASSHNGVTLTPSDNFGNTWTSIAGPTNTPTGFDLRTQFWYARNPIVGPGHTVTMSISVAQPLVISIIVVKGSNISSPIDAVSLIGSDNGTQALNVVSPAITTTASNDLLVGFVKASDITTFAAGTGFTQQAAASSNFLDAETGTAATPGSYSATFTLNHPVTWQSGVVAAATNQNQSTLSWTAATETGGTISSYLVERCQGVGCSGFSQVGTTSGTVFNDTGLSASTSYTYRVRAKDAANNVGPYSNLATITVPPVTPSLPGNLAATPISKSQVNLTWTASAEIGGSISNYLVERCEGVNCSNFAQIATLSATSFSDTSVPSSDTFNYRVRALDSAGNVGPYSNVASATTPNPVNTVIAFVQGNFATPQTAQTRVAIPFTKAQGAGDLNVVAVGWNDSSASVTSVTDTVGNTYTRAVGPTAINGVASQSIYYAKNIASAAAGANTVTVAFSPAAAYPDIRILEYSGIDPINAVDVTAGATGNSASSASNSVTTTNANDLIFGANLVQTLTSGAGTGFTSRILTSPDGDIAEDKTVTASGSYNAVAPMNPSGQWIMQMVAFRAAGGSSTPPPTAPTNLTATAVNSSQINLGWSASTSSVGIASYVIQRCQGQGCTNYAQLGSVAGNVLSYNDTGLSGSTTYTYQVQAFDTAGNPSPFSSAAFAATTSNLAISPRATALTPIRAQQFTTTLGNTAIWQVDGVTGGTAATGTISTSGLYTPPATAGTHTVTVALPDFSQSANATAYITNYRGTFTRDVDNMRTGLNPNETVLSSANVTSSQFGKQFSYPIDGTADASPLYVSNVSIPGKGARNVVYVATEHDSVYAFDGDGLQSAPLWQVSFLNAANGVTSVPACDTGECNDISPEIGITGSPVIDPSSNTLYVVAKTKEVSGGNTTYVHRLHAMDLSTGAEKFGGPVVLQASVPGTGAGSSGGRVPFISLHENQRPALLLNNGIVYFGFGSHGDVSPYHGWVLGYNATTLQQVMAFCTSPNDPGVGFGNGQGSGVWQSGDGITTDATNNLYFVTGEGLFDANNSGPDYGDTFLKVSPAGSLVDYFTPHDQQLMDSGNIDLGSGGVLLLPDQPGTHPHLALTAGKSGTIYLVDRDNLGHFNPNNDNQVVQTIVNIFPNGTWHSGNFKAPVYWNGHIFFSPDSDYVKSFTLTNGLLSTVPTAQSTLFANYPGATLGLSSNGNNNAILWAIQRIDLDPTGAGVRAPGVLHAFDATSLTELYNSGQASGSRDAMDYSAKWSAPLIANGRVYVASLGQLTVYGLLP